KTTPATAAAAISPSAGGELQPSAPPCITSTCSASIATRKASTPGRSNFQPSFAGARLSGVPRTSSSPLTPTTAATQKIERQPKFSAISPPTSEHSPAPPQVPIDHMLTARWRPAPSQPAFSSARLAGMMQAADSPCSARPDSSTGAASAPSGVSATSSAPVMPSPKPMRVMRTRPTPSASPPMTTAKMPANSEVSAPAVFIAPAPTPRSAPTTGATLSIVWANSQNDITPSTSPASRRSLPPSAAGPGEGTGAASVLTRPRFHRGRPSAPAPWRRTGAQGRQSGGSWPEHTPPGTGPFTPSFEVDAWPPAAFLQERLRVVHLQDPGERLALVVGALVVGLDDAVAHPVAEVVGLVRSPLVIVRPFGQVGAVHVLHESGLDLQFAPAGPFGMARVADPAGHQFGDEFRRALHQRPAQHRGPRIAGLGRVLGRDLLGMHVFVRDHVHEAVLQVRVHEVGGAQRLQPDRRPGRIDDADRPPTTNHDRHRWILGLRVHLRQPCKRSREPALHRRQHLQAPPRVLVDLRVGLDPLGDPLGGHPPQLREFLQAGAARRKVFGLEL